MGSDSETPFQLEVYVIVAAAAFAAFPHASMCTNKDAARTEVDRLQRTPRGANTGRVPNDRGTSVGYTGPLHLRWCKRMRLLFSQRRARRFAAKVTQEAAALKQLSAHWLDVVPDANESVRATSKRVENTAKMASRGAVSMGSPGAVKNCLMKMGTMLVRLVEVSVFRGPWRVLYNAIQRAWSWLDRPLCLLCGAHYGTLGCLSYELKLIRRCLEYVGELGLDGVRNHVTPSLQYRALTAVREVYNHDSNIIASWHGWVARAFANLILQVPFLAQVCAVLRLTDKIAYVLSGAHLPFTMKLSDWVRMFRPSKQVELLEGLWHLVGSLSLILAMPGSDAAVEEVFDSREDLLNLLVKVLSRWFKLLTPYTATWLSSAIQRALASGGFILDWDLVLEDAIEEGDCVDTGLAEFSKVLDGTDWQQLDDRRWEVWGFAPGTIVD